jgi:hypothetical protein
MKLFSTAVLLLPIFIQFSFSQEKKSFEAFEINSPLIIDGVLDEDYYKKAQPAKDFLQIRPYNGKPSFQPSEVYIFYDQTAIYLGAYLYDSAPDSIFNYFSERDKVGMSDYFSVYIDPYNEGQLAYGFYATPSGVQTDVKAMKKESDVENYEWDAVWESKTKITDKGWTVEMKIPYAALRFPEKPEQTWGINMYRNIRRYNSNNSWNFINAKISGYIHQEGMLTGIKNIKPPVRLSFSPYAATYMEFKENSSTSADFVYKGGMDLKYGISESFTLDMMLIPDFGQVQSDDQQLNLSPYELYYDEKRQFFNEGTELLERGGIFYSRRMGSSPKFASNAYSALKTNEIVDFSPNETKLVNATKVSGRTSKGLGLAMLNTMTLPSYSTLIDTITDRSRDVLVQPFTNYNVSVIDQSLNNNSHLSLINSNVSMFNNPFSANVTATDFQFRDRSKKIAISGKGGISTRGNSEKETGYFGYLGMNKIKGSFLYGVSQELYSDKYNPNDLGYLKKNNFLTSKGYLNYLIYEPFGIFRELSFMVWNNYTRMYNPGKFAMNEIGVSSNVLFKNNYSFNFYVGTESKHYDYYDTRVQNRYLVRPTNYYYDLNLSTDDRKPVNLSFHYFTYTQTSRMRGQLGDASVNVRLGMRLLLNYSIAFSNDNNYWGFVSKTTNNDTIHFAVRDISMFENVVSSTYALTNNISFNLRIRHYWSGAANKHYYILQKDGSLKSDPLYLRNHDSNYNAFNIDMIFRWIFAPGSELTFAWKNAIYNSNNIVNTDYFINFDKTLKADQINSFSIKMLYYIDYNWLRRKKV